MSQLVIFDTVFKLVHQKLSRYLVHLYSHLLKFTFSCRIIEHITLLLGTLESCLKAMRGSRRLLLPARYTLLVLLF